jgi:hypothetical protein
MSRQQEGLKAKNEKRKAKPLSRQLAWRRQSMLSVPTTITGGAGA